MCEYKSKLRGNLKAHLANVHDIGVNWHSCHMCEYKCKCRDDLKKHLAYKHNIDVEWVYCLRAPRPELRQEPRPQRRQELQRPRSGRIETEPTPRGDVPEDVWQEAKEMMADGRLPTTTSDQ